MQANASTSRYILTALCIILVITAFILIALNAFNLESKLGFKILPNTASSNELKEQYNKGFQAARDKYKLVCPMVGKTGNTIGGTVVSVGSNSFAIKQNTFDTDEAVDGISDTRTVTVGQTTKFELTVRKNPDILSKELAAFKPDPKALVNPPSPFISSSAKISDLKVGDNVTITSEEELRTAVAITAKTININR